MIYYFIGDLDPLPEEDMREEKEEEEEEADQETEEAEVVVTNRTS